MSKNYHLRKNHTGLNETDTYVKKEENSRNLTQANKKIYNYV